MMKWLIKRIDSCILLIPLMTFICFMAYGCKSIEYIPVETVKIDSLYLSKVVSDSVVIHDSVYIKEKGDTIFQFKYKYIYKDKVTVDTTYIERTDTLRIPYAVERKLSSWEKIKIDFGGYTLAIGCFILLIVVGMHVIKLKK